MIEIDLVHHFCNGVYAKETHIPAESVLSQHIHPFDHLSVLMSGAVLLVIDGESTHHTAPAVLTIRGGCRHSVIALTDVIWLCVHKTKETDPARVDSQILKG